MSPLASRAKELKASLCPQCCGSCLAARAIASHFLSRCAKTAFLCAVSLDGLYELARWMSRFALAIWCCASSSQG